MSRRMLITGLVVALTAVSLSQLWAAKHNSKVDIGDKAATWSDVPGTDGKTHSLSDFGDAKAVVVVFTCNNCPVAVAYEDRLIDLARDYKDKKVAVVAINVNKNEDLKAMKARAEEKGFNFPYLYDESQESAREYGATCTPHVFVLDGDRTIAYMGAVDDNMNSANAEKHYLRDAIDAVLAGKKPETTETKQVGCSIKWKS